MPKKNKADDGVETYSKRITVKDISEKAGVSIGTVDRALNGRGRISSETKQKVLKAAEELHYQRNEFARSLRVSKKVRLLTVCPQEPKSYMQLFTDGFEAEQSVLSDYGLQLDILKPSTLNPSDIIADIKDLDVHRYDGILINAGGPELDTFINNTVDAGVPVATYNSDSPSSKRAFFSGEDHFGAGRLSGELVAKLLRETGTVSIFSGLPTVHALKERTRGFADIITADYPNVSIINDIAGYDDLNLRFEKAEELLFGGLMPEAVFCNSATGAYPVCCLLEKYKVKNRPIVVGYDEGDELKAMLEKGLCTALIYQHPRRQARSALRFMFSHVYSHRAFPTADECLIIPSIMLKTNAKSFSSSDMQVVKRRERFQETDI